jgi:hypothetical protein
MTSPDTQLPAPDHSVPIVSTVEVVILQTQMSCRRLSTDSKKNAQRKWGKKNRGSGWGNGTSTTDVSDHAECMIRMLQPRMFFAIDLKRRLSKLAECTTLRSAIEDDHQLA